MEYTEKELEIVNKFEEGFKDQMNGSIQCYDFGTRREGLTDRVKEFLKTLGVFEENDMYYGVEFKR